MPSPASAIRARSTDYISLRTFRATPHLPRIDLNLSTASKHGHDSSLTFSGVGTIRNKPDALFQPSRAFSLVCAISSPVHIYQRRHVQALGHHIALGIENKRHALIPWRVCDLIQHSRPQSLGDNVGVADCVLVCTVFRWRCGNGAKQEVTGNEIFTIFTILGL
jgi:hypothetical protein